MTSKAKTSEPTQRDLIRALPMNGLETNDRKILEALIRGRESAISDDGDKLLKQFSVAVRTAYLLKRGLSVLKPLIGKMLLQIRDKRLYERYGYRSFNQFMSQGMPEVFGIPRSEAFGAKRIAERWPSLSLEEFAEIGPERMRLVSRVTQESDPNSRKIIEAVKKMKVEEVEQFIEEKFAVPRSSNHTATIIIRCTEEQKQQWQELVNDPDIAAYCGSDDPGFILSCLIGECIVEWKSRAKETVYEEERV